MTRRAHPLPAIYLASASPRRAELLPLIGVSFEVLPLGEAGIDESVHGREAPAIYVRRLALAKARAGAAAMDSREIGRAHV